jgi:hypothetical protein
VVDEQCARTHSGECTVRPIQHGSHVVVVADAHEHDVDLTCGLRWGRRCLAAVSRYEVGSLAGGAVPHPDLVPCLHEPARHVAAHHAEPKKRDLLCHACLRRPF